MFNFAFAIGWECTVNHLQMLAFKSSSTAVSCPYSTFSFQTFPNWESFSQHWLLQPVPAEFPKPLSAVKRCIPVQCRFMDHQHREMKRLAWCPRKPEGSSILSSARDFLTFFMPPFPRIWIENNFAEYPEIPGETVRSVTLREKLMPKCDILNDCSIYTFETSATTCKTIILCYPIKG